MTTQNSSTGDTPVSTSRETGQNSHDLLTCTVKNPPFSFAQLEIVIESPQAPDAAVCLDNLQVRSYCNAALRQFLGVTGSAVSIDILKVNGRHCWLRIPRPDLGPFAAAITAWAGVSEQGNRRMLRVKQCSDYLGAMVGADEQDMIWTS